LISLIDDRFLVGKLRLEYVIGGGNVPLQEDMEIRSQRLPGNQVRDFYRVIIKDIVDIGEPTTSRALQALFWIKHAKQPLTERVLREAIGASSTDSILRPCMSLVVISENDNFFQFSHTTTVSEFLADPKNFEDLGAPLFSPFDLAKRCLEYLDSPEFESIEVDDEIPYDLPAVSSMYGFGGYAATYWADHVRDVESDLLQGMDSLPHFNFLASKTKRDSMLKLNRRTTTTTILHFAADKGLSRFYGLCLDAKARFVASCNSN
jgi:hypothetical protein